MVRARMFGVFVVAVLASSMAYAQRPNGFCTPAMTTVPSTTLPSATFEVYERMEDISQKFRPPFYIE